MDHYETKTVRLRNPDSRVGFLLTQLCRLKSDSKNFQYLIQFLLQKQQRTSPTIFQRTNT